MKLKISSHFWNNYRSVKVLCQFWIISHDFPEFLSSYNCLVHCPVQEPGCEMFLIMSNDSPRPFFTSVLLSHCPYGRRVHFLLSDLHALCRTPGREKLRVIYGLVCADPYIISLAFGQACNHLGYSWRPRNSYSLVSACKGLTSTVLDLIAVTLCVFVPFDSHLLWRTVL